MFSVTVGSAAVVMVAASGVAGPVDSLVGDLRHSPSFRPATRRQMAYLDRLGVRIDRLVSIEEASREITAALRRSHSTSP